MNEKVTKLLKMLEFGGLEMEMNRTDTYHNVKHRFRDTIIVPLAAISNNIDFILFDKAKKHVRTSDDVECIVTSFEEKHICDIEQDIKDLYKREAWEFLKTWHQFEPCMTSTQFVKLTLKKDENPSH